MKIDINKKYRTRDGREVIIHAVDGPEAHGSVIASVKNPTGLWDTGTHDENGLWSGRGNSPRDLIEVREPREWKAVVVKHNGVLTKYDEGDERHDFYEVIRVREIID